MRERTLFISAIVGIVLIAAGFVVASQANVMPPEASTRAVAVDQLFRILLGISTVIFLLVEGALVFAVLRFRQRPGDDRPGPAIHGNTSLEILWTLIPAAIVVVLGVYSFQVLAAIEAPGLGPRVVEVVARQFSWQFRYPEADLATTELHLPVGQPVVFQISAEDVIHSFWVPAFRAKRDATPGQISELAMTPIEVGRFPIRCAELCGAGHAIMTSEVVVESAEEFDAWLAEQLAMANDPAQIFLTMGCGACHVLTAAATTGTIGPSLDDLPAVAATRLAGLAATDYVEQAILAPDDFIVPGFAPGLMPKTFSQRLTPDQIQRLAAFLLDQP
ncbi:MAG: cytochrome c oxidase subunit II [Anaerolineales bacterium]|nr:cytochrome c oxidase subunit II [Anaerolineales bacterium]